MGNCLAWLKSILPFQGTQHNIAGRRLREVRVLAEGGYGYIWRVQDTRTGNYYALKKMICQVLYAIIQSPETRRNFENEQTLGDADNIIRVYGVHRVERQGFLEGFILMELADRTLFDLLVSSQNSPLIEDRIIKLLIPVCRGLKHMHEKGVTHRDIKVENILLTSHDTVPKICDFGSASKETIDLAKISKNQLYTYEDIFERNTTLMYRPPQMIDLYLGYRVDQKVDIWMLGCVVYTMNYYVHPFQEVGKLAIVNANFKFPELARVSEKMKDFIRHMLTPDPGLRPDINQVLNILENWLTGEIRLNDMASVMKQNDIHISQGNYELYQRDYSKPIARTPQQPARQSDTSMITATHLQP